MTVKKGGFGDYGARAKAYGEGRLEYPNWIFEKLMDKIADAEHIAGDTSGEAGFLGAGVLDVACGTGIGTRQLWDYDLAGFGVDHDSRMIKIARKTQFKMSGIHSGFTVTPPYMVAAVSEIPSDPRVHAITTFGGLYWFHKVPGSMGRIWHKLSVGGVFMAADEHHLYHDRKYADIKRRYIEGEVPAPDNSFVPAKVLQHHGFINVDTHERDVQKTLSSDRAYRYLLSASWINLVASKRIPALYKELRALVQNGSDATGRVQWRFRFTATFGTRGSGGGL